MVSSSSIIIKEMSSTVSLMTVGMLPVTKACSVPQTSSFVTGDWDVYVQLVKAGDRGAFIVKSGHFYLHRKLR